MMERDSSTAGSSPPADLQRWIESAQAGCQEALGRLLQACRDYLLLVANQRLPADLRAKIAPSDLVEDTNHEALRDFPAFRGTTEADLLAWLRGIPLHNLANGARRFRGTGKRQVGREVALAAAPPHELVHGGGSPGSQAAAREQDEALRRAIDRLPEDYRQVIRWRSYDRLSFAEVGQRLGRSAEAARKLWARAVEALKQALESPDEPR